MTKSPSDQTLESLSALADGETTAFESRRLLAMAAAPELQAKWQSYHLAGSLIRHELGQTPMVDLSARISAAIANEDIHSNVVTSVGVPVSAAVGVASVALHAPASWRDWVAKSAIAASVAVAVIVGVQFSQTGTVGFDGAMPIAGVEAPEPVIAAPTGFDLPAPVARNVSLGSLVEPQRKLQAATPSEQQQFLSNAAVEAELQQLFLEHAQLSAQNGKFGLMPMARAAKMQPAE